MKTLTLSEFKRGSYITPRLITAVVNQLGGWREFKQRAFDIRNHGLDGGFSGFTYYEDTVKFTARNKTLILDLARSEAAEFGYESIAGFVAGMKCLRSLTMFEVEDGLHNRESDDRTIVYNALAWYAGEAVACSYIEIIGE